MSTLVFNFGRYQPPTIGHQKVIETILSIADQVNGVPRVYLSHSHDFPDNPIPYATKLKFMQHAFGEIVQDSEAKTVIQILKDVDGQFSDIIMVVGQDRVANFQDLMSKYNGNLYNFNSIQVVSAGDRDDNAEGIEGVSASKMRAYAANNDMEQFMNNLPVGMRDIAKDVFNATKGIVNEDYENKELNIHFHDELNPKLFKRNRLLPEVRNKLLKIAADFKKSIGVDLDGLVDITISGSNAAFTYTDKSDIDLHLIVKMPDYATDVYKELFDSKKFQYNSVHHYQIRGYDVELYVQDAADEHISQGIYSIMNDEWIREPVKETFGFDEMSTKSKYNMLKNLIEIIIDKRDLTLAETVKDIIKKYRKAGLRKTGEFGPENLAFKALRANGYIERLMDFINEAKDEELSLEETVITEVNMSPSALSDFAKSDIAKNMTFGFEAEVMVPGLKDMNPLKTADFSSNESLLSCKTINDLKQKVTKFFSDDPREDIAILFISISDDFEEYARDEFEYSGANDEYQERVRAGEDPDDVYEELFSKYISTEPLLPAFLKYNDLEDMIAWHKKFGLHWPTYVTHSDNMFEPSDFAEMLKSVVGMNVNVGAEYHVGIREDDTWVVEPDLTITPSEEDRKSYGGIEVISPPMPFIEGLEKFETFFAWANEKGFKTNQSTGFHVGLSMPNQKNVDELKLVIMLGDEHVLREFGRLSNVYAESSLGKIKARIADNNPALITDMMDRVKRTFDNVSRSMLSSMIIPTYSKYVTVHKKDRYIEFRSAGGDYIQQVDKLKNTIFRYVRALASAADPEMDRQEYLKKLYKVLSQSVNDPSKVDVIKLFAMHSAGRIPAQKLASMLKSNRPSSSQWQVVNTRTGKVETTLTAKTKAEAIKTMQTLAKNEAPGWLKLHTVVNVKGQD